MPFGLVFLINLLSGTYNAWFFVGAVITIVFVFLSVNKSMVPAALLTFALVRFLISFAITKQPAALLDAAICGVIVGFLAYFNRHAYR